MGQLLVEILQEEIPARMQEAAAVHFGEKLREAFAALNLSHAGIRSFSTPLRLVAVVEGLPTQQPDQIVEKKGPLLGASSGAIEGFLRSVGVGSVEDCQRLVTPKGEALLYQKTVLGQATRTLLPEIIARVLQQFRWPKSMRMNDADFRWVRPLRQVMVLFEGTFLSGKIPLVDGGYMFENQTVGKNFVGDYIGDFSNFSEYQHRLSARGVILDQAKRRAEIARQLEDFAARRRVRWWEDQPLLAEVSGFTENICVLSSSIESRFMALPEAVLRLTIRSNQKYFLFRQLDSDAMAPFFAFVTSNDDPEAAETIVAGNVRVLRARLSDAEFFLEQDQRYPLLQMGEKLDSLRFVAGLGSMADKCQRMSAILKHESIGAIPEAADTLPILAKADLMSGMVGEFPELQGVMGGYYAQKQGLASEWAQAIATHYSPKGPNDAIPESDLGRWLAVADKLDTIAGFASKGELPKGSGDPFAIRRAMLGVIRILLAQQALGQLPALLKLALKPFSSDRDILDALWGFYQGRMVQFLRDEGVETAVAWAAMDGDPDHAYDTAREMQTFMATESGQRLRQAYVRAHGILRQYKGQCDATVDLPVQHAPADKVLLECLRKLEQQMSNKTLAKTHQKLSMLGKIAQPLDRFFDEVMVNSEQEHVARFRHSLLRLFVESVNRVANFERLISG